MGQKQVPGDKSGEEKDREGEKESRERNGEEREKEREEMKEKELGGGQVHLLKGKVGNAHRMCSSWL